MVFDGWQLPHSSLASDCGADCRGRALWRDDGLLRSANSYPLPGYESVSVFTRPNGPIIEISNVVAHSNARSFAATAMGHKGAAYQVQRFNVGRNLYVDEPNLIESMPHVLAGLEGIVPSNQDSIVDATEREFLCFDLSAPATVYVLYDNRADTPPGWLSGNGWRNEQVKVLPHTESDSFKLFGMRLKVLAPRCFITNHMQYDGTVVGEVDHILDPELCCQRCDATEGCSEWTIRKYRCATLRCCGARSY
jgi:hypothetical protein